jgi:hypothetical protein
MAHLPPRVIRIDIPRSFQNPSDRNLKMASHGRAELRPKANKQLLAKLGIHWTSRDAWTAGSTESKFSPAFRESPYRLSCRH